ncbi:MAG: hypothetical protein AAFN09_03020 [Pseudomonadota bacterium]
MVAALGPQGWAVYDNDPDLTAWLDHVRPRSRELAHRADLRQAWLRHGGTWFAGVDVLENDEAGRVADGPPLSARALEDAGALPLHPGQLSVTYPGYPRRDADETDAAHGYRLRRDAAHLDGLLPIGAERRRMIREPHAWVLGLPLDPMRAHQAPLVVWEGSQEILREALRDALRPSAPESWSDVDVTEVYQAARREIFKRCPRVEITAEPGQAILLHRLSLHGVGPWPETEHAGHEVSRAVIYFRPLLPGGIVDWLTLP